MREANTALAEALRRWAKAQKSKPLRTSRAGGGGRRAERAVRLKGRGPFGEGGHGGGEESGGGFDAALFGALDEPQPMVVGVFHLTHQIEIASGSSHEARILLAVGRPALPPAGRPSPTASSHSNTSTTLGEYDVSRLFQTSENLDSDKAQHYAPEPR